MTTALLGFLKTYLWLILMPFCIFGLLAKD